MKEQATRNRVFVQILTTLLLVAAPLISAFTIGEIDLFVQENRSQWSGMTLVIASDNRVIVEKDYGEGVRAQDAVALNTVEDLVTAMAIAKLVEEGKVSWDQSVKDIDPTFFLSDSYVTKETTVRDLLAMRGGLSRLDLPWRTAAWYEKGQENILRRIVEKRSGELFSVYVQKTLLSPLGIDHLTPYGLAKLLSGQHLLFKRRTLKEMQKPHVSGRAIAEKRQLFPGRGDFRSVGLGWHLLRVDKKKVAGRRDGGVLAFSVDKVAVVVVVEGKNPSFANGLGEHLIWGE